MLNTIHIMGRLTADPIPRETDSGIHFTTFSIAVQRPKRSGEESEADFFNCIAWNKLADIVEKWYSKGEMILLAGTLRNHRYTDKNGVNHTSTQIVVREVHFTGGIGMKKQEQISEEKPDISDELALDIPTDEELAAMFTDDEGVPF